MSDISARPRSPEGHGAPSRKASFEQEVTDAALLLNYAISSGAPTDRKIDDELIVAIERAQDFAAGSEIPKAEDRARFESAYRDLALLLRPVTVETLKATSEEHGRVPHLFERVLIPAGRAPESTIWSRKLSAWAIVFLFIALLGDWFDWIYGPLPERGQQAVNTLPLFLPATQTSLKILVPFTYGAIGACLYLLKACQTHVHMRQFDPRRMPEYYNRMILGGAAGGVIVLLVNQLAGDDGTTVRFSAAALGFLAGYNNDLLFGAVERISAAILPKVGITTVRQEAPRPLTTPTIEDVSLKDLLARYQGATSDEEKKLYAGLIQKIQNRL
jgi:hypothetical protein